MVRHWNVGPFQVVFWPRHCHWYCRRATVIYRWVIYIWPFELRRFN